MGESGFTQIPSAAAAVVQFAAAPGALATNPSTTATAGSNVTNGNLLVVFAWTSTITSYNTPTGTGACNGIVYTAVGSLSHRMLVWTAPIGSTSSCSVTVSANTSGQSSMVGIIYELKNVTTTGLLSSYGATGSCNSCTGQSITTVSANTLCIILIAEGGSNTVTSPSPFTFDINQLNTKSDYEGAGNFLQVSTGTFTPTWTTTGGPSFDTVSLGFPHS